MKIAIIRNMFFSVIILLVIGIGFAMEKEKLLSSSNKFGELVVLVTKQEAPELMDGQWRAFIGPTTSNLLNAIKAKSLILATKWVVANVIFLNQSASIMANEWNFFDINNDFYLLVPKSKWNEKENSMILSGTQFSENDLKIGLKLEINRKKMLVDYSAAANQAGLTGNPNFEKISAESIIEALNATLITKAEAGAESSQLPYWNIYLMGHGWYSRESTQLKTALTTLNNAQKEVGYVINEKTVEKQRDFLQAQVKAGIKVSQSKIDTFTNLLNAYKEFNSLLASISQPPAGIAGLTVKGFQEFLNYLNKNIYTNFLIYESCYSGGDHLVMPYLIAGVPVDLNYTVVATGLIYDVGWVRGADIEKIFQGIKNNISFAQLVKLISPVLYLETGANIPLVKLPHTTWFQPQFLEDAQIITQAKIKAALLEKHPIILNKKSLSAKQLIVVFTTNYIPAPIQYFTGKFVFAPESTMQEYPGDFNKFATGGPIDYFAFESIEAYSGLFKFINSQFAPREKSDEQYNRVYYVNQLIGKNDIKEVLQDFTMINEDDKRGMLDRLIKLVPADSQNKIILNDVLIVDSGLGMIPPTGELFGGFKNFEIYFKTDDGIKSISLQDVIISSLKNLSGPITALDIQDSGFSFEEIEKMTPEVKKNQLEAIEKNYKSKLDAYNQLVTTFKNNLNTQKQFGQSNQIVSGKSLKEILERQISKNAAGSAKSLAAIEQLKKKLQEKAINK